MSNVYYETIDAMEKAKVDAEYINGWACGFLHNPKREEQRTSDAYEAGYEDGLNQETGRFRDWVKE